MPPEHDESMVNIGRNGRFIFDDGRHRLMLAKIMDIDEIPVRVLVRHKDWQNIRMMAYKSSVDRYSDHPDLTITDNGTNGTPS